MQKFLDKIMVQLRHFREANDLSQTEMAEKLGCGLRSYQRYEAGESIPTIDFLYQVSIILNFDLETVIAPYEKLKNNPNTQFFSQSEESLFREIPIVKNSGLFELYESEAVQACLKEGNVQGLKNYPPFMDSSFALTFSTPRHTLINKMAQDQSGFNQAVVLTNTGHEDISTLGLIWGTLIEKDYPFLKEITYSPFPKGRALMTTHGIFKAFDHKYFVLAVQEIQILKK